MDRTDALLQLFKMTFQFGRWHERNFLTEDKPVSLPESVQMAMDLAVVAAKKLYEATDKALRRARKA